MNLIRIAVVLALLLVVHPALAGDAAEQNRRNLRRDGCRKTEFVLRERQNVDLAATSPNHRILKVEFFDLVKEPIPGTNPVEVAIGGATIFVTDIERFEKV